MRRQMTKINKTFRQSGAFFFKSKIKFMCFLFLSLYLTGLSLTQDIYHLIKELK